MFTVRRNFYLFSFHLLIYILLSPPLQKPGKPSSLFHDNSPPILKQTSATSLLVQIGPPLFDGGSKLSSFLIEWDVSASFDSSQDRAALGSGRIDASYTICTKCVTKFDVISNVSKFILSLHLKYIQKVVMESLLMDMKFK